MRRADIILPRLPLPSAAEGCGLKMVMGGLAVLESRPRAETSAGWWGRGLSPWLVAGYLLTVLA